MALIGKITLIKKIMLGLSQKGWATLPQTGILGAFPFRQTPGFENPPFHSWILWRFSPVMRPSWR